MPSFRSEGQFFLPASIALPAQPLDGSICAAADSLYVAPTKQSRGIQRQAIATGWPAASARSLSGWPQGRRARRV